MKKLLISLTVLIGACISFSSCLKDAKVANPGFDVDEVGINTTILFEVPLDVYLQADRAIRFQRDSIVAKHLNSTDPFNFKIGYINVTVSSADTITYPKTITLDFGIDSRMPYQGKMSILMDGNMRNSGSKCALTFINLSTYDNPITGKDTIISMGKNTSGSIVSHFKMHEGLLKGYLGNLSYSGNVIGKYNLISNANVLDSVEVNATDVSLNTYKVYSVSTPKLQIDKGCNFFKFGVLDCDYKINNSLAASLVFSYGYSALQDGTYNACDADGIINVTSKINTTYVKQFAFIAKEFK